MESVERQCHVGCTVVIERQRFEELFGEPELMMRLWVQSTAYEGRCYVTGLDEYQVTLQHIDASMKRR